MARTCVFCGGSPTTKEHLWPDWARRLLAEAGPLPHRMQLDRQGQDSELREWLREAYSMTVRCVCAKCNNGWMSELESRARELFHPMLHGRGRVLHRGGQATLGAWALKTAMMFEHAQAPGRYVIPRDEYEHLYATGEPSERILIWMATYVGDMPAYGHMYGADAEVTQHDERGVRDVWGATIGFGPVVFQVFGTTLPGVHDEARTRVGSSPVVHELCPYQQSFTWSPVAGLDDTGLTAFSEAIYGEIARGSGGSGERGA